MARFWNGTGKGPGHLRELEAVVGEPHWMSELYSAQCTGFDAIENLSPRYIQKMLAMGRRESRQVKIGIR